MLISSVLAQNIDPNYNFETFMRQFDRTYTGAEKDKHEIIFNKNYQKLKDLVANGEDLVVNNFLDWDEDQLACNFLFNLAFNTFDPLKLNIPVSSRPLLSSSLFASPPSFDWRARGRVTSVKNQGSCGSCWAFSATAQYESMLAIETNGTLYDLAEQYAVECETNSAGCNGGYPWKALRLFNKTGIPL